jgi:hypothetical protein
MAGENRTPPAHDPGNADQEQRIRERAYRLWEADGSPEGKAEHYWYQAQELIESAEKPDLSIEQLNDLA